ncbi:10923_t:CDS:2 [Cetraspora pellucida]|uniref:10923_t:CDS:1 n=1 Tax=Cetraspora pellucida TaxID=1433469 RepID=A0A9N9GMY5_9GLOM|nr:10923_t:CDS:2 [Cetraspora pellucida]
MKKEAGLSKTSNQNEIEHKYLPKNQLTSSKPQAKRKPKPYRSYQNVVKFDTPSQPLIVLSNTEQEHIDQGKEDTVDSSSQPSNAENTVTTLSSPEQRQLAEPAFSEGYYNNYYFIGNDHIEFLSPHGSCLVSITDFGLLDTYSEGRQFMELEGNSNVMDNMDVEDRLISH